MFVRELIFFQQYLPLNGTFLKSQSRIIKMFAIIKSPYTPSDLHQPNVMSIF